MTTEAEYAQRKAEHLSPVSTLTNEQLKAEVGEAFARLAAELGSLSEAPAAWKPAAGEWSAAEVGDHVGLGTGAGSSGRCWLPTRSGSTARCSGSSPPDPM